jgi:two-component system NtrC family response regulator
MLPALRDRDDDILLLAQSFLHRFASESGKPGVTFGPDALRAIRQYTWPGNVRELQNRIKRAVIMSEGKRLSTADLELEPASGALQGVTLKEARERLESEMIRQVLRKHTGKITSAAVELGISRPTLYELMDKLGIEKHGVDKPE